MLSYGLYPGLQDYFTSLTERSGERVQIELNVKDEGPQFPRQEDIHFFRIVQQACENALEHANPAHIVISGYLGETKVSLRVEDDGQGFEWESEDFLDKAISQKHFGIAGMLERGEIIGAKVEISSAPKAGTRVRVNWEAPSGD
jgi:signal transduction histidine kinase